MKLTLTDLEQAACLVHEHLLPTPQLLWPLLTQALGCELWVKHENHLPTGAFKVRGGVVYFAHGLEQCRAGVITATRGNHGQSLAWAARRYHVPVQVVVPLGNSASKNAAMRALGAQVIEYGADFQAAREYAGGLADAQGWHFVPSFHPLLVAGVASYALELFKAVTLDRVYVPIGLGSGICGVLAARDALGLNTEVVGVVAAGAPTYLDSLAAGAVVEAPVTTVLGDGLACRRAEAQALALLEAACCRVVAVSDAEMAGAIRLYYEATHQVSEGAGAAALAAALQERSQLQGLRVAVVLSGGNIDRSAYVQCLS